MSTLRRIPGDLAELMESGVTLLVGTRDARLRPEVARSAGAIVSDDRTRVTIFVPDPRSSRTLANIRENGRIAVGVVRPLDNAAFQVKGPVVDVHLATDAERATVERYLAAYVEATFLIGVPRALMKRITVWPAHAVAFDVHELFQQTPGPDAGKPIAADVR